MNKYSMKNLFLIKVGSLLFWLLQIGLKVYLNKSTFIGPLIYYNLNIYYVHLITYNIILNKYSICNVPTYLPNPSYAEI